MRITLLREFIALCENLNFSKTAQQLFITESTLSKHIASLEHEVGAILLSRNHHNIELTSIGKIFLKEAVAIVARYDAGMRSVKTAISQLKQELRIGYLSAQFRENLISSLPRFKMKFPNVCITLIDGEYGELIQKLNYGVIDVLLTSNFERNIKDWCNVYKFCKDVLCVAMRSDNPLAQKEHLSLNDLRFQHILLPNSEIFKGYTSFLQGCFNKDFFRQEQFIYYSRMTSALLLIESDNCIALVPHTLNTVAGKHTCFIPLSGKKYTYDIIAAWKNTNNNPIICKFAQILSDSIIQSKDGV